MAEVLARSIAGQRILKSQVFHIDNCIASGNSVAVEARWTGVLAIPLGTLAAGAEMRAHFAMFFELVDGRIHRQRNYDCFEPWQAT